MFSCNNMNGLNVGGVILGAIGGYCDTCTIVFGNVSDCAGLFCLAI